MTTNSRCFPPLNIDDGHGHVAMAKLKCCGSKFRQESYHAREPLNGRAGARAFRDTYPDGAYPKTIDKQTYLQRFKLFQNLALSSFTFRHGIGDQAVPYRQIGAFRPGDGVGGAGLHWAGMHWRVLPEELSLSWRW